MNLAASLINRIVEDQLPRFTKDKVYYFKVFNPTRIYLIEYYRPNNYTSVHVRRFLGKDNNGNDVYSEPKLYSCHDSCWRSDGTETILRDIKLQGLDWFVPMGLKEINVDEYIEYRNEKYYGKEIYNEEIMRKDFKEQEKYEKEFYYDEEEYKEV